MIFQTKRLKIRKAETSDVEMYLSLWNSGKVMRNVGFPNGLGITAEIIEKKFAAYDETEFDQTLVSPKKKAERGLVSVNLAYRMKRGSLVLILNSYLNIGERALARNSLTRYVNILSVKLELRSSKLLQTLKMWLLRKWQNLLVVKRSEEMFIIFPKRCSISLKMYIALFITFIKRIGWRKT